MKNVLIGALVAAAIIFIFQAMSWMVLPIHTYSMKHTPHQDAIMAALQQHLTEAGLYAVPTLPPTATQEERSAFEQAMVGKPWALINFNPRYGGMMASQFIYGFLLNFLAAFVIGYVMLTCGEKFSSFGSRIMLVFGFVAFLILQSSLMQANWWETPWHYLSGEIIDHVIGWFLGGLWLAWWMGRKQTA